MSLSVIIPSRNVENLRACVAAVRTHEPSLPFIIIDDGIDWGGHAPGRCDWYPAPSVVLAGQKPFVYARNCNLGIRAAGRHDVILLNDDALLKVNGGFTRMQQQWRENQRFGLIASSIDHCGTPEQIRRAGSEGLRPLPVMAVFACVFIPRSTIDRVGLLDERYGVNAGGPGVRGYGVEDYDYSKTVRRAGLQLAVSDGCFVTHTELPSTFRHRDRRPGEPRTVDVKLHERLCAEKWGERGYV